MATGKQEKNKHYLADVERQTKKRPCHKDRKADQNEPGRFRL